MAALVLGVASAGARSRPALAGDDVPSPPSIASRITMFAGLGYGYPMGGAERGTDTRDVSFGIVPLSLAGTYDLDQRWNGNLRISYAPNIPTLCASGPDCFSSLGRDVSIAAGIGRTLPRWGSFVPELDVDVGWEWLTTKLSDAGVASTRSWNGPIALVELFVNLRSRGPWSLGPTAAIGAGVFSHFDVSTPAWQISGATASTIHLWPIIGFRAGRRL